MNNLSFSLLQCGAYTWEEFLTIYNSNIRVNNDISKISPINVELMLANESMDIISVKYEDGKTWRDGEPIKLYIYESTDEIAIVRIPVFKIENDNRYLVVDGNNRMLYTQPNVVLMDVVTIEEKDCIYVNDMIRWLL